MATIHRVQFSIDNIASKDSQDYLASLYSIYINDFLSFDGFADYHGLTGRSGERLALKAIKLGRDIFNGQFNRAA